MGSISSDTFKAGEAVVVCSEPACRHVFSRPSSRLGLNERCPKCDAVVTLRSLESLRHGWEERARLEAHAEGLLVRETLPVAALLENIRSLWNVGSIFRTAEGLGFDRLALCGITGAPPRREIAKTALGAEKIIPWRRHATVGEAVASIRRDWPDVEVVAIESCEQSCAMETFSPRGPCCMMVGNEVSGLSAEALALADVTLALPMRGVKRSFNVAVAFGMAAYQLTKAWNVPADVSDTVPDSAEDLSTS